MASHAETLSERPRSSFRLILLAVLAALLSLTVISIVSTQGALKKRYGFIKVDHPVDMWNDGRDRWIYYFTGEPSSEKVAEEARKELLPLGFREDVTKKPWFRFVKGRQEVIVCLHHEVQVNGTKLEPQKPRKGMPMPTGSYTVVHVKNGPGSKSSLASFQVLKLLNRW